jgi:hypothetical protein
VGVAADIQSLARTRLTVLDQRSFHSLPVQAPVKTGINRMVIAIADVGDADVDSAVLLGSINCGNSTLLNPPANPGPTRSPTSKPTAFPTRPPTRTPTSLPTRTPTRPPTSPPTAQASIVAPHSKSPKGAKSKKGSKSPKASKSIDDGPSDGEGKGKKGKGSKGKGGGRRTTLLRRVRKA